MSPLRAEIDKLSRLAIPVVVAQVGSMLLGVVDTVMVGHLSVQALAAVSLASVWIWGTLMFAQGVVLGMDPLVAQAHGAGDGSSCGLVFQRALVISLALSLLLAVLWLGTGPLLALLGQDATLATEAHRYTRVQIPSLPFFMAFVALRQYLQDRALMRPAMWVVAIANLFNVVANWALIFGHWGAPALGLAGAGIASGLTRAVMLGLLWAMVGGLRLHRGAWTPWGRASFDIGGMRRILAFGMPVALQMALEVWAFAGSTLLAGRLGRDAVAAHHITLNLAALAFMIPLGVSQGATTRVGNLLGGGHPRDAERAAWVALGMGAGTMTVWAVLCVSLRHLLPQVYTSDPNLIALSASILPIAAAFAVFDGVQVVGCGVLRGMGDTRPAARYNLLGYWLLGLPLGAGLGLYGGLGLAGIWWGLALGLAVVAGLLLARIRGHGPARGAHHGVFGW